MRDTVAANPYWQGRPIQHRAIETTIRSHYLDIQLWPFSALIRQIDQH